MDNAITIMQGLIGVLLAVGGLLKIAIPYAKYSNVPAVGWSKEFTPAQINLIGFLEMGGGVGLIVPLFLDSPTLLAPLAAVGIALYMAGAMATHLRRSEYLHMVGNLMLFLVPALLVAYDTLVEFVE